MIKQEDKKTLFGLVGFIGALIVAAFVGKTLINKKKEDEILDSMGVGDGSEDDVLNVRCHKVEDGKEDDHIIFEFIDVKFRTAEKQITAREFMSEFLMIPDPELYRLTDGTDKVFDLDEVIKIADIGKTVTNIILKADLEKAKDETVTADPGMQGKMEPVEITLNGKTFMVDVPKIMAGDLFFTILKLNEDEYCLTRSFPEFQTEEMVDLEEWISISDLQNGLIRVMAMDKEVDKEAKKEKAESKITEEKTVKSSATIVKKETVSEEWVDPKENKKLKPRILTINGAPRPVYRKEMTGLEIKNTVVDFRNDPDAEWKLRRVYKNKDGNNISDDEVLTLQLGTKWNFILTRKVQ